MKSDRIVQLASAGLAALGITLLPLPAAIAQEAAEAAAPTTPAAEPEDAGMAEVVVTAQRREEKSRDVPISITALNSDQLATANVEQLADTAKLTPGLRFDAAGPAMQPSIRGVGTAITTSGGGPNVGIYVDGFFRANTYAYDFQLMNVDSIQILKGPQGTLFGRNTTGGAILVSTADPSRDTSVEVKAGYARFNAPSLQAYATTGVGDHLAFDIEGLYRRGDGYFTDITNGDDKVGQYENWSVRTGMKADFGDAGTLLLRYEHSSMNDPSTLMYNAFVDNGDAHFFSTVADPQASYGRTDSKGLPLIYYYSPAGTYATKPGDIALNDPVGFRLRSDAVEATYKTGFDFADFTSYTQYRYDDTPYYDDLDSTTVPSLSLYIGAKDTTISQEFLLNSKDKTSRLQWTAGANYFYYKDDWSDLKASGYLPTFGADPDTTNMQPFGGSSTTTSSLAAFADVTYALIEQKLFLTLGGRYSHDTVTDAFFNTTRFTPFTGYTGPNGENIPFSGDPQTRIDVPDLSDNNFSPRAVLRYKPSERSSVYASYSQGYKAGILNVGGSSLQPVKPEKNNAYEIGYKYEERKWALDLATFLYDYKDLQVSSFQGATAQITNAATARVYGAEGQIRYNVMRNFDVNLGATWTHATYRSFEGAPFYGYCDPAAAPGAPTYCASGAGSIIQIQEDASGNRLQRSPEFTGNLGASYLIPTASIGEFTVSGNLYYSSDFYFDPGEQFHQDAYSILSLRTQWADPSGRYTIAIFGDNVGNKHYLSYINANTSSIQAIWASPITYGITFGAKF